jgi:hypothetical protein
MFCTNHLRIETDIHLGAFNLGFSGSTREIIPIQMHQTDSDHLLIIKESVL